METKQFPLAGYFASAQTSTSTSLLPESNSYHSNMGNGLAQLLHSLHVLQDFFSSLSYDLRNIQSIQKLKDHEGLLTLQLMIEKIIELSEGISERDNPTIALLQLPVELLSSQSPISHQKEINLYEIPVQMIPFEQEKEIHQNLIETKMEVEESFKKNPFSRINCQGFVKSQYLTATSIKKKSSKCQEAKKVQKSYQAGIQTNFDWNHLKQYEIVENQQSVEDWKNVENSIDSIRKILCTIPKQVPPQNNLPYIQEKEETEDIDQNYILMYEVPVEVKISNQNKLNFLSQVNQYKISFGQNKNEFLPNRSSPIQLSEHSESSSPQSSTHEFYSSQLHELNIIPPQEGQITMLEHNQLKEKMFLMEEQKNSLLEQILHLNQDNVKIKDQMTMLQEFLEHVEKGKQNLSKQLIEKNEKIVNLENSLRESETKLKEIQKQSRDEKILCKEMTNQILELNSMLEKMKQKMSGIHHQAEQKELSLNSKILDKQSQIQQLVGEVNQERNRFHLELLHLHGVNEDLSHSVQSKEKQLEIKNEDLKKIQSEYDEIIAKVASLSHSKNIEFGYIYEEELQKIKQAHEQEIIKKNKMLERLEVKNKQLELDILKLKNQCELQKKFVSKYQQRIQEHKQELINQKSNLKKLEEHKEREIQYLREKLFQSEEKLETHLRVQERLEKENVVRKSLTIEWQEQSPLEIEEVHFNETEYIKEIFSAYQQILMGNQQQIMDLQGNVIEYLTMAIQKQEESEELQFDLYELLSTNKSTQKENKRLKRLLKAMQQRLWVSQSSWLKGYSPGKIDTIEGTSKGSSTLKFQQ